MKYDKILTWAFETFDNEIQHLDRLKNSLANSFIDSVKHIYECKGRVVVCGIGKSAIIGQKIVATLNSTGTPSIFLHAAEAVHGDLGMVQQGDIVLMISNSGNSPEIKALIPFLKQFEVKILSIGSKADSFMAKECDEFIQTPLDKEADPNGLAPTTSTTMQLLVGDAISVALIHLRKFDAEQFSKFHPGGSLGKKLYLTLKDVYDADNQPYVGLEELMPEVVRKISDCKLGAVAVLNSDREVMGVITDGDIRRALMKHGEISRLKAKDIMTAEPLSANLSDSAYDTFMRMESKSITQIVLTEGRHYKGLIHLHQILKAGVF